MAPLRREGGKKRPIGTSATAAEHRLAMAAGGGQQIDWNDPMSLLRAVADVQGGDIEPTDRNTFVRTDGKPFTPEQLVELASRLRVLGGVPLRQVQRPDGKWETLPPPESPKPGPGASTTAAEHMLGRPAPLYTIGDVSAIFGKMSPESRWTILQELYNVGILTTDPAKLPNTTANNTVASAIADLLYEANLRGTTWSDALSMLRREAQQAGTYGAAAARKRSEIPLTVRLTNPADIKLVADYAAQQVLGRRLTTSELQQIIDAQHAAERTAAEQSWDMTYGTATGGEYVEAPSTEALTEQVISQTPALDKERRQMDLARTLFDFVDLLKSPVR